MTEIKYKGEAIATLESNQKAVLHLKDKKLTGDIDIVAPAPVEDWDGSVVIEGGVELIDFTIDGVSYQAIDGMTWAEWCDSEYNIDNTYYYDNYYINSTLKVGYITIATNNYQPIPPTDAIIDGKAYMILSTGGAID